MAKKGEPYQKLYDEASDLLQRGKGKEAKKLFLKALEIFPKNRDMGEKAFIQCGIGEKLFEEGLKKDGRGLIKNAMALALSKDIKGSKYELALTRSSMSATAARVGLKKEAKEGFKAALGLGISEARKQIVCEMASAGFVEDALEEIPKLKNDFDRALVYSEIISAYAEQGKIGKALELMPKLNVPDTALNRLAGSDNDATIISQTWLKIAAAQAKKGKDADAKASFANATEATQRFKDPFNRTWDLVSIGEEMGKLGYRKEANGTFQKAIDASKEKGDLNWMLGVWKQIYKRQKEYGYTEESESTAEQIKDLSRNPKAHGTKVATSGETGVRVSGILVVIIFGFLMWLVAMNTGLIQEYVSTDLAFILAFVLPLVLFGWTYFIQTDMPMRILRGLVAIILFFVTPPKLALLMFIVMLGLAPSASTLALTFEGADMLIMLAVLPVVTIAAYILINRVVGGAGIANAFAPILLIASFIGMAFMVGSSSPDIVTAAKAASLFFLVLPFAANLFVVGDLMINMSPKYSGAIIAYLPVFYIVFALLGAILGAGNFLIFG
ncbi:MAG: hypothetical protein ABII71_02730 [Candidatus Micrarchaeota archaeon]